jgi:hypothetical protein
MRLPVVCFAFDSSLGVCEKEGWLGISEEESILGFFLMISGLLARNDVSSNENQTTLKPHTKGSSPISTKVAFWWGFELTKGYNWITEVLKRSCRVNVSKQNRNK